MESVRHSKNALKFLLNIFLYAAYFSFTLLDGSLNTEEDDDEDDVGRRQVRLNVPSTSACLVYHRCDGVERIALGKHCLCFLFE